MTAVIVEFPVREKQAERPARDQSFNAQVIIFNGVRHERLDATAGSDDAGESAGSHPSHRKKSS